MLTPLDADRDQAAPPADLAARTLARVAEHVASSRGPAGARSSDDPAVGELLLRLPPERLRTLIQVMDSPSGAASRSRRADVAVAAVVLLLAIGIVFGALPYLRHRQNQMACQNKMRELHGALQGYADTHDGRFPQVNETPPNNTASSFRTILINAGALPPDAKAGCPAGDPPGVYAYSLGWRDEQGHLFGLRREPAEEFTDQLPILADRPPPARDGTPSIEHGSGQNVLYIGGNVRFCTDYFVGVERDDIYRNKINRFRAGVGRIDSSLGLNFDEP